MRIAISELTHTGTPSPVKFVGMSWNRNGDTFESYENSPKHKRQILASLNSDKRFNSVLLPKSRFLTTLIIKNKHDKISHSGVHSVGRELRKEFWMEKRFSAVKKVI